MKDKNPSVNDLAAELERLRNRIAELEASGTGARETSPLPGSSEECCRLLFESNPQPMWVYDMETLAFLAVNDAAIHKYGFSREEFLSMTIADIRPPEDIPRLKQNVAAVTEGLDDAGAWRHRIKDGTVIDVEIVSHTLTFQDRKAELVVARDITGRKMAEHKLMESEHKFRQLIETTHTGYVIIDEQGRIIDANQEYLRLTGRTRPEEIIGHSVTEWTAPHDQARNAAEVRTCLERGFVRNLEIDYVSPAGVFTPVEINASVLRNEDSLSILSVCRDISERRRSDAALQESERKYRELFDSATDAIFILDLNGGFIDVNGTAYARLGYTKQEMLSMSVSQLDPPEFAAKVPERLAMISRDGQAVFESAHVRKDGSVMPVEINCRLLDYKGRKVYFSIIRDITERKRAEELLRASEEQLRVIVDTSQAGIILVDPEGRIIFANNRMAEMFGMPIARLIGTSYPEHLHETEKATGDERMRQLIRGEIQWVSTERHYIRGDGSDFWGYLSGRRLENPDGTLRALVGVIADITDRKKAEQERLVLERRLLHAQKLESLGILAGGIAHDFNNLLMAILGNLDLAMLKLPPDSPARENIEQTGQAALRAADLTRQMLAYSGRGRFVVQALDLNKLVEENVNLFRAAVSRTTSLHLELTRPLPLIEADAGQIQQVIMNLFTNASEAIGETTGVISLITGSQECDAKCLKMSRIEEVPHPGKFVYLEVSDTGAGMDEETQQRLFDPFFTTKTAGRGLGMSAILGIVRGHHGAIFVDSAAGKGTTIRILFPAMEGGAASTSGPAAAEAASAAPAGTVLVVDDEEIVLNICKEMLKSVGMEVLTASDGREALDVFRRNAERISLVILDLTMPVMDGITAFRELVRIRPGLKIILSSGYDEQDSLRQLSGEGLAGFIKKPYTLRDLRETIQRIQNTDG